MLFLVRSSRFQIGFTFYYWPYYKNLEQPQTNRHNLYDHGGYKPRELYISPKYDTFQEEIGGYRHLNYVVYKAVILAKVKQYIKTNMAKKMVAKQSYGYPVIKLFYDIDDGVIISFNHLLSLCLYTDLSESSTHFSATFRKLNNFESLESVKERNRNYYFMSKYLRECIQLYGEGWMDTPVFCGLSRIFHFPEFDIRLCAPSSTTYHREVAIKFLGDGDGIVVKLKNEGMNYHDYLRGFSCSWISASKEESEVLWMSGIYMIRIISITIMDTKIKYQISINALTKFNQMFNGGNVDKDEISPVERDLICDLLSLDLDKYNNNNLYIDGYTVNTFKLYKQNKIQIYLDIYWLTHKVQDKILLEMIMNKMVPRRDIIWNDADNINLFRGDIIFSLFQNIQNIVIRDPYGRYPFSFPYLFSMISSSNASTLKSIKIMDPNNRWLYNLWSSYSSKLKSIFNQNNFDIQYKKEKREDYDGDCILILKR